jgi:KaiC/GvpD/RAD55 family RecA-like ATPase
MEQTSTSIENTSFKSIFTVRSANDCMEHGQAAAVPRRLYDELWREGEMAVLYGEAGTGKSLLAMHIAQLISRGTGAGRGPNAARPQKVLYIDLKLTDEQFQMRYSAKAGRGKSERQTKHKFGDNLLRVGVDLARASSAGPLPRVLANGIRRMIKESGAKVVVLDSLSRLRSSNQGSREEVPIMRELDRIRRELGVSILVVTNAVRRDAAKPIELYHLHASRVMASYADSIFALVKSRTADDGYYIKQVRSRSGEIVYTEKRVLCLRLVRKGAFLGFADAGTRAEALHLELPKADREMELLKQIVELVHAGLGYREIEEETGIPRSTAQRKYKKALAMGIGEMPWGWTSTPAPDTVTPHPEWGMPWNVFRNLQGLPCFSNFNDQTAEGRSRLHQGYLVNLALAEAKEIFKKTGTAPDTFEYIEKVWHEKDGITETVSDVLAQYGVTRDEYINLCSKQRYVQFYELEDGGWVME